MAGESNETQYDPRLRITPQVRRRPVWQEVEAAWANLTDMLTVIGDALGKLESLLREMTPEDLPGYDELLLRAEHLRRFATDARVRTGHIIFGDEESIAWLTHERLRDSLTLTAAPLSVAEILQAQLFAQKQTSVL
ncbi:MAG: DNA polymerase III subunit epsilon, partial [Chloroflexaceae bacterium]